MHGSADKGYDDYGSKVDKYYVGMKKGKKKKEVLVDLTVNTGSWVSLGTFDMIKGTKCYVMLSSKADFNVIADAVKFVKK